MIDLVLLTIPLFLMACWMVYEIWVDIQNLQEENARLTRMLDK